MKNVELPTSFSQAHFSLKKSTSAGRSRIQWGYRFGRSCNTSKIARSWKSVTGITSLTLAMSCSRSGYTKLRRKTSVSSALSNDNGGCGCTDSSSMAAIDSPPIFRKLLLALMLEAPIPRTEAHKVCNCFFHHHSWCTTRFAVRFQFRKHLHCLCISKLAQRSSVRFIWSPSSGSFPHECRPLEPCTVADALKASPQGPLRLASA